MLPSDLASNFDERWQPAAKEFVIGNNGVAVLQGQQREPEVSQNLPRQYGIDRSGGASLNEELTVAAFDPELDLVSRHIGPPLDPLTSAAGAPRCGPSPLGQDQIKALVVEAARRHGVDDLFASAITWAESSFDQVRNSPKGARGPMQLMPQTAARFGVADLCDPAQNIEGGMTYLRVLFDEFQNPLLVAAAYNSGEQRIYEYGGVPPFPETVGYVAKVLNYQLGLPMPSASQKMRTATPLSAANASDEAATGVIAVKKTGTFVGGVMHF